MLGVFALPILLFATTISVIFSQSSKTIFKSPPSDALGVKHHNVTLYCHVATEEDYDIYWHCNFDNGTQDITVGPNVNTNFAIPQYIIDNFGAGLGQYNLIITNVTALDSGTCHCVVVDGIGNAEWTEARLEIVDSSEPPEEPSCSIEEKNQTHGQPRGFFTADDTIILTCESKGGVPLASVHWEIVRNETFGISKIPSSASTTSSSITIIAEYNLTYMDDGAYFQCVQSHIDMNQTNFCNPLLAMSEDAPAEEHVAMVTVIYPPVLTFIPDTLLLDPGRILNITLKCTYSANPDLYTDPVISHHLPSSGVEVVVDGSLDLRYTIAGQRDSVDLLLKEDDIGKMVECEATNDLGKSVITLKIEKNTKPKTSVEFLPLNVILVILVAGLISVTLIVTLIYCLWFTDGSPSKSSSPTDGVYVNVNGTNPRPGLKVRFKDSVMELEYHPDDVSEVEGQPIELDHINIHEFEGGKEMQAFVNEAVTETAEENVYSEYIGERMINLSKIDLESPRSSFRSGESSKESGGTKPPAPLPKQHFYEVPLDI